jgi:hypothetical protein
MGLARLLLPKRRLLRVRTLRRLLVLLRQSARLLPLRDTVQHRLADGSGELRGGVLPLPADPRVSPVLVEPECDTGLAVRLDPRKAWCLWPLLNCTKARDLVHSRAGGPCRFHSAYERLLSAEADFDVRGPERHGAPAHHVQLGSRALASYRTIGSGSVGWARCSGLAGAPVSRRRV